MSYALRNTILIFIILIIMSGAGWGWLEFKYGNSIGKLETTLVKKEARLSHLELILADYDYMEDRLTTTLRRWNYYPKVLLPENAVHETYKYLESIASKRASFDYEFRLSGIENRGDIVYANYQLKGSGKYSNVNRFIQYLENSKPIFKIESLNLSRSPGSQTSQGEVNVTLKFKGIFVSKNNANLSRDGNKFELGSLKFGTNYDPFRPFVLNKLPKNVDNLLVVERAKVVAILKGLAYIQGRSGNMRTMRVGDRVYLGILEKINLKRGEVIFAMNRGGIFDRLTLRLEN